MTRPPDPYRSGGGIFAGLLLFVIGITSVTAPDSDTWWVNALLGISGALAVLVAVLVLSAELAKPCRPVPAKPIPAGGSTVRALRPDPREAS